MLPYLSVGFDQTAEAGARLVSRFSQTNEACDRQRQLQVRLRTGYTPNGLAGFRKTAGTRQCTGVAGIVTLTKQSIPATAEIAVVRSGDAVPLNGTNYEYFLAARR